MTIHLRLGSIFPVEVRDDEDPINEGAQANLLLGWDEVEGLIAALVAFADAHGPRALEAPPDRVMGFNRYRSTYVAVAPV